MNQLLEWLSRAFGSWKFWIVVPPWDIGVRVRLGRRGAELEPGPHWRIPFLDDVLLVNTRLRIASAPPVTLAAGGNRARMVTAVVGFRVADPVLAMMLYEQPATAVIAHTQAEVAKLAPAEQCAEALAKTFSGSGIVIEFVQYVEDVEALAVRTLGNQWAISDAYNSRPHDAAPPTRY